MNMRDKDPNDPFPKEERASLTHSLLVVACLSTGLWLALLVGFRLLLGY
jgi:hypothetical protein